ncbi:hypothetical protein IW150_003310, partial [Coemansia sp. RSA 2607]
TGYCPLGGVKVDVMNDEFVKSVAETHRCTPAQVALSWALSRGIAVIPKTTSKLRLKENLKKIKLTFDEKHAFSWIKTHERKVDPGRDLKELDIPNLTVDIDGHSEKYIYKTEDVAEVSTPVEDIIVPPVDDSAKSFPRHTRYSVIASCFVLQGLSCGLVHSWGVQQRYLASNVYADSPHKIKTLSYIEGIVFGIGIGLVFSPTSTAPARWFTTHRGLATGITVAGVGVGGLIIAPLTDYIVREVGVKWSLRVSAIYIIVLGSIACFFVRVPFQDKARTLRSFDWGAFNDRRFAVHSCMVFFVTAAYIIPYSFLPTFWAYHGISSETSSVLIAVANVASSVGRIALGLGADHIGVLNSLVRG